MNELVIEEISQQEAKKMISEWEKGVGYRPLGLFYVKEESGSYTGFDNSAGNCSVETWPTLELCLAWLRQDIESPNKIS